MLWKKYGKEKEHRQMENNKKKTINVLGTTYTIETSPDITNELIAKQYDGEADFMNNTIHIKDYGDLLPDNDSIVAKKEYYNVVLRHELTHAFFHEAGLDAYAYDETLVDFIALQFPKLQKLFKSQEV